MSGSVEAVVVPLMDEQPDGTVTAKPRAHSKLAAYKCGLHLPFSLSLAFAILTRFPRQLQ
jgi:hypothetical protein